MNKAARRRLRVDPTLCDGYGYCAELVPELISLDDWGYPIMAPVPIGDDNIERLAQKAVATCPRLALLLEEVRAEDDR